MALNKYDLNILFSIVVLTYNRKEVLDDLLSQLTKLKRPDVEILIVDNGSTDGTRDFILNDYPDFRLIQSEINLGAIGRNLGMAQARGDYVVTIDDDILDLNGDCLDQLRTMFEHDPTLGAVCFKVMDFYSGGICNWCHPKLPERYSEVFFETNEITEGAVAFRKELLEKVGLYPEDFFISHEGADLVARILDYNYRIFYTPTVAVRHKYATHSRPTWRRYYYDTRNDIWLVVRNYRPIFAFYYLARRLPVTFLYALRDGFLGYWFKAIWDALAVVPKVLSQRKPMSSDAQKKLHLLNRDKPGIIYFLKNRLFSKQVKI